MQFKKRYVAIVLVTVLILFSLILKITTNTQLVKESIQVQILENLYKPLDLIYLPLAFMPNKLPKYEITVSDKDIQKLYDTLPKSKNESEFNYKRIVENRIYVPIRFKIDNKEYAAKMSVRGVNPPHYLGEKKSLRVRVDGNQDSPINGLNFLVPEDRYFVDDLVSYYFSEKLNLFALRPGFANLNINGRNFGVYETLPDEEDNANIELSELSTSDILYRDESKPQVLANHPKDSSFWSNLFTEGGTWQVRNSPEDNDSTTYSAIEKLVQVNKKEGESFFKELSDIVDTDQMTRFIAHNFVMGDWHQGNQHNKSLIFLKETGKFNFIPNDNSVNPIEVLEGLHFDDFTEKILKNPQYYWNRNKILWEIVNDENFKNELRSEIDNSYNLLKGPIYQDNPKAFRFIAFRSKIKEQKKTIFQNLDKIKSYFNEYYIDANTKNFSNLSQTNLAVTRIRTNAYFQPILKTVKFEFSDVATDRIKIFFDKNENESVDSEDELVANISVTSAREQLIDLNIPLKASRFTQSPIDVIRPTALSNLIIVASLPTTSIKDLEFSFSNSLSGQDLSSENNILDGSYFVQKPQLPGFIGRIGDNKYQIDSGTYNVSHDIIIPEGELTIAPGTTLLFDPKISLISRASIIAKGTSDNPIFFTKSSNGNWGGVLVTGPNEKLNIFEHVSFDYGVGVSKYGFKSTGMLSIHFSNVRIENSRFSNSLNDDALNVKHGSVILKNNLFQDTFSDAIDVDTASGEISYNEFKNIGTDPDLGGDAIDTSFSTTEIKENNIFKASDKCLSIGEKSKIEIIGNHLENCEIGIAIKDGSEAKISDNTIRKSKTGISAYLKKPIYKVGGIATLEANVLENNIKNTEVDINSLIN